MKWLFSRRLQEDNLFLRAAIQQEPFNAQSETARIRDFSDKIGGIVTFLGVVRDLNEGNEVQSLFLEHYPGMTERQLEEIARAACDKWDVLAISIIHRIGNLYPNDEIVFVGVGGEHRAEAFMACEYIMDYLKTNAAFWKKEQTVDGSRWLVTRDNDLKATNRWKSGSVSSDNEAEY